MKGYSNSLPFPQVLRSVSSASDMGFPGQPVQGETVKTFSQPRSLLCPIRRCGKQIAAADAVRSRRRTARPSSRH